MLVSVKNFRQTKSKIISRLLFIKKTNEGIMVKKINKDSQFKEPILLEGSKEENKLIIIINLFHRL